MSLPRVSLQVLEAFERVAHTGSVRIAAGEMGLSISTVSAHIARLEDQLGITLFDRTHRPFILTHQGKEALRHLSLGLNHLRRATSETAIAGLLGSRSLRIGIVEDFESSVAPELAVILARRMPRAKLSIRNVLSHEAQGLVRNGHLDIAIASQADSTMPDIRTEPLLRDPFMIAVPRGTQTDPARLLQGHGDLPLLRFNPTHLIGKQIEAHLARSRITLPERYAFDSAQSIMAIIANGGGWSILTPLGIMRAQRFSDHVHPMPLPLPAFARTITLLSRPDFDAPTAQAIAALFRQIVTRTALTPFSAMYPALSGTFALLGASD